MRKLQLWSIFKEITQQIDGWDQETFEKSKDEMTFVKYLPSDSDWNIPQKYIIRINIEKEPIAIE